MNLLPNRGIEGVWVDTSVVVSIWLEDERTAELERVLEGRFPLAANLIEAELRSVLHRERRPWPAATRLHITWVHPDRPLSPEYEQVLEAGSLRGAALFHVAAALYAFPAPERVLFATVDARQNRVAKALGFRTLDLV